MVQTARYFDTIQYTEAQYAEVQNRFIPEGIIRGIGGELAVSAAGGMIVRVALGEAFIQGFWYKSDAVVDMVIPANSSGGTRTDAIALTLNRVTNQVVLTYVPNNTPAVRTAGGNWEMRLATIAIPNGAASIVPANITDIRAGATCGFTGPGLVQKMPTRANVSVTAAGDFDTGLNILAGQNDWVELVAGGNPQVIAELGALSLGTAAATTSISIGHNGIWTGVFSNFSISGPPSGITYMICQSGETGYFQQEFRNPTATRAAYFIFGAGLGTNADLCIYTNNSGGKIYLGFNNAARLTAESDRVAFWNGGTQVGYVGTNGRWVVGGAYNAATVLTVINNLGADHGIAISAINNSLSPSLRLDNVAAGGATFGLLGLALTPSHFGETAPGDLWLGTGANGGHLRFGTAGASGANALLRMTINNAAGGGGVVIMQASNTVQGSLMFYRADRGSTIGLGSDASGRLTLYANGGAGYFWMHPSNGNVTLGSAPTDTARLHIAQPSGTAMAIRMTWSTGDANMWIDDNGWLRMTAASNAGVALIHGSAYFCPPADQATNLGHPNYRWANGYFVNGQFYGSLGVSASLTVSGNTTISGNVTVSSTLTANSNLNVPNGTVTAAALTTGGATNTSSLVCGVSTFNGTMRVFAEILPGANDTRTVGNAQNLFSGIYCVNGYKTTGASWSTVSDDRTKVMDAFRPYEQGLGVVLKLEPVWYTYNGDYGQPAGATLVGFRSSHLREVMPELVETLPVARAEGEPEEEIDTVNVSNLTYAFINAIKELHARVEVLEAALADRRN